jgi:hypothetical protein
MRESFLFASLHPNAGARIRSKIALLPDSLLGSHTNFGDAILCDQHLTSPMPTEPLPSSGFVLQDAGENSGEIGEEMEKTRRHFMCLLSADRANSEVDLPGTDPAGGSASALGLATYLQSPSRLSPTRTGARAPMSGFSTTASTALPSVNGSRQPQIDPSKEGCWYLLMHTKFIRKRTDRIPM